MQYGKFLTLSLQNFVKVTVLLKKLLKNCFDEIFFLSEEELLVFPRCGRCGVEITHSVEK